MAHDLAPSDTASLDKNVVKGIVTAAGGPTSHAAIMARTLEIPAVMGVGDIEGFVDGEKAVVLGTDGIVETNPSDAEWIEYTNQAAAYQEELKRLRESANLEATTTDGHHVELFGNIGKSKDAKHALTMGAQGIGLYRTEFLYMETMSYQQKMYSLKNIKRLQKICRANLLLSVPWISVAIKN